ncbi:MAG: hypothetical protein NTW97_12205 [Candidatus Krumholzibacteria bacterium]|nr:hypothetical protein [Candidatus Krumholzibacteria bacterium]
MPRRLAPLAAAFVIALGGGSSAAPGGSPSEAGLTLLSRTLIQGPARSIAFSHDGNDVVVGTGCGIAVLRGKDGFRNPAFLPLDGEPLDMIVRGPVAYVAAAGGGLVVFKIFGPDAPREIFRHARIRAEKLALAQGALFAADMQGKLHTFEFIDSLELRFVETKQLPAAVISLAAEGDLLAIVHPDKVSICRIAPGGAIREISQVALGSAPKSPDGAKAGTGAKKGIISRKVLLVLTSAGDVQCWDLARPDRPAALEPLRVKGVADVAVSDGEGMLLTGLQFLLPFDVERPSEAGGGARVKLKSGKGFSIESLNRYAQPLATGSPAASETDGETQRATGVFMAGKRLAVVAPFDGVRVYDLDRGGATFIDFFPTRGFAISLVAADGLLYVANGYDGVRIGRVGRDGSIDWIGHIQTVEARDVALGGAYLFIADGMGGLKAADVSDPARAKIVGRHESPYFMSALVVKEGRAYCAGGLGGVEIVDVAEPRRPKLVWRRDFSEVRGIDVDGRYLYFADGYEGCRIYSLAAGAPAAVSVLDTPGWNCDCFVVRNIAYLADGGAGISVVDVSDRKKPRIVGSLSLGTVARAVHAFGKTLFAAAHTRGVAAIDVSNPSRPSFAAWYDTADDARGIFVDDNFVYAASGSGGVYVFRYSH